MNLKEITKEASDKILAKKENKANPFFQIGKEIIHTKLKTSSNTVQDCFHYPKPLHLYTDEHSINNPYLDIIKDKEQTQTQTQTNNLTINFNAKQIINLHKKVNKNNKPFSSLKANVGSKIKKKVKFDPDLENIFLHSPQIIPTFNSQIHMDEFNYFDEDTVPEINVTTNNTLTCLDDVKKSILLQKYYSNNEHNNSCEFSHIIQEQKFNQNHPILNSQKEVQYPSPSEFTEMTKLKAKNNDNFITYTQKSGSIMGFSAHTYKNRKKTNEDKLGININFKAQNNSKIDFYGIYDGHNGSSISELLNKTLHTEIYSNESFPLNPIDSILKSFNNIENSLIEEARFTSFEHINQSGSSALLLLVINDLFYIANLGDSRAIISSDKGLFLSHLTIDHKPDSNNEMKRIQSAGGRIERTMNNHKKVMSKVYPGGLLVSRSIGDMLAKLSKFGGKEEVISSTPDIFEFKSNKEIDYIILGTNSIYEKLSNKQIALITFETLLTAVENQHTYKEFLGDVIINIMQKVLDKNANDNLSLIFLVFDNIKQMFDNKNTKKIKEARDRICFSSFDCCNLYDNFISKNIFTGNIMQHKRTNLGITDTSIFLKKKSTLLTLAGVNYESRNQSVIEKKDAIINGRKKRNNSCCGLFT